ncbi:MAG TPA: hypothetical protein VHE35_00670 [Kofleriaceae bacterium]|nr:hypothetical protein [Kofleriaceae bacterium]
MNRSKLALALATALGFAACGGSDPGPLDGIDSLVFLQRTARNETGDIFQYSSYKPGGRLMKLSPPTADGKLTELCCSQQGSEFADIDISAYDLSFDAKEIVFSGKLSANTRYGLFILHLDTGVVDQLNTDPNADYFNPVFLPGDKILFNTNKLVEPNARQFQDEYERGVTAQVGVMNRDGTGEVLGARNLSHRVSPSLLSNGRVIFTQWDHMGEMNAGHLLSMNPDMTTVREAFGKEGSGITNSYLKAREISPGRLIAIGTSRDRTLQSGALLDIRLGEPYVKDGDVLADQNMSEATASYKLLTPNVPLDREPAPNTVGRYYDAYPLDAHETPNLLVSWSDGPVESGTLGAAGLDANFGIYLFDSAHDVRKPIYDDPTKWDIFPRPLVARDAPPQIASSGNHQFGGNTALLAGTDVYKSSITTFAPGSVYGVRVTEGFSVEEGVPRDFGLTEFEGAATLGIAPVEADGSFAALVPAGVPVRMQAIDKFGLSMESEPVWVSGASGESRACGGCHESRTGVVVTQPGVTQAIARGPVNLRGDKTRAQRVSNSFTIADTIGVPWDQALQGIFDRKCVSCHEGTPGPANPSWTLTDPVTNESFTWTFDLRGGDATYGVGDFMFSGYSPSHLSLMGPSMRDLEDTDLVLTGDTTEYIKPGDARGSELIKKLNPPQFFPTVDMSKRAFSTTDFPAHAAAVGQELTADEYYLLVLMADNGGQFYSRENAPGRN